MSLTPTELKPKVEQKCPDLDLYLDPGPLAEPVTSYFHGCLGNIEAERRLKTFGENGAYLLRESDVKQNMFIISSIKDASVTHLVVPNNKGKFLRQKFKEAHKFIEDVVRSCEGYLHPVPPSGPLKFFEKSEARKHWNKCYCCNFTSEDIKILDAHKRIHKLEKCDQCSLYKRKGTTMQTHKKRCNTKPEELVCKICGFKTFHLRNLIIHNKGHKSRPFLCDYKYKHIEDNCRRRFKTEEELRQHSWFHHHSAGFQCRYCEQMFTQKQLRTRHMERMHQHSKLLEQKPKGRTMYKCQKCEFKSHQIIRLKIHQMSKHTERTPKTYICEFCNYKANWGYVMKRHRESCKIRSKKPIIISMIGEDAVCMQ